MKSTFVELMFSLLSCDVFRVIFKIVASCCFSVYAHAHLQPRAGEMTPEKGPRPTLWDELGRQAASLRGLQRLADAPYTPFPSSPATPSRAGLRAEYML